MRSSCLLLFVGLATAEQSEWARLGLSRKSDQRLADDDVKALPHDPFYTHFHPQPLKNWLNDPNGPMYFNGNYHLFFQYNPEGARWGDMHWYHMMSKDLIHWEHLPVALAPDQKYDCGGIFSGSATIFHNATTGKDVPVLTYSVACGKSIVNAFPADVSDPKLINWTKPDYNPVIPVPSNVQGGFRDPTTAWQGKDKTWRLLVGCGNGEGTCQFKSKDFIKWDYVGAFHSHGSGMWECPDFYNIPGTDKYVLKASAGGDWWALGSYKENSDDTKADSFTPISGDIHDDNQKYDFGTFYASKVFQDPVKKRAILFGWVNYNCPGTDWTGIQTFPRKVSVDPADPKRIVSYPIEEISILQGKKWTGSAITVPKGGKYTVPVTGNQLDVQISFAANFSNSNQFHVTALAASNGTKGKAITMKTAVGAPTPSGVYAVMQNTDLRGGDMKDDWAFDGDWAACQKACTALSGCKAWTFVPAGEPPTKGGKALCSYKSSVATPSPSSGMTSGVIGAPAAPTPKPGPKTDRHASVEGQAFLVADGEDTVDIRLLVDHSVVEVYAQGGRAVATRPYCPTSVSETTLLITNDGPDPLIIQQADIYQLATANVIPNP